MRHTGEISREIVARMKAGDPEAFNHFFEHHAARVLVYINYNSVELLRRKVDPDDILQEVHLKIVQDFASFYDRVEKMGVNRTLIRMADHALSEAYRSYLKTEKRDARREIVAGFLRAEESGPPDPLAWVPSDATSISARIVRNEEYRRVMALLHELSPLEQYVTVARVIEEVPAREIAERLGKTRGAVEMIIARARDKIRKRASQP